MPPCVEGMRFEPGRPFTRPDGASAGAAIYWQPVSSSLGSCEVTSADAERAQRAPVPSRAATLRCLDIQRERRR